MKVAEIVKNKIDRFPDGYVFTYDDFDINVESESVLKIALYRLVKSGKINRLAKGKFYKPKQGIVGTLKPDVYEIVKDLLKDGNKITGYLTGYSVFNRFNLTTQVPNTIQIGVNFDKKGIKRGIYTIKFVRQRNKITQKNIPLLQLLDCVRFVKIIPDATINNSIQRIKILIQQLSDSEKSYLTDLAANYPPSTKALTGAMLELLGDIKLSGKLFKTLKSTTWYSIYVGTDVLPNKKKWRIR
ncbi:MAG: DUF6088 family protein [Bacteroidota bacterium]|nr:DUF6088 family protein [Bacteroidota bacterium]